MYAVKQFDTLAELEHFLNVNMLDKMEVVGFQVIDFQSTHEYIVIIKYGQS